MNNLSAFTDVINGLRHAIITLNNQFLQLRSQLDEVKNKDASIVNVEEIKQTIIELQQFKTATDTKLGELSNVTNQLSTVVADVQDLKQSFTGIEEKLTTALCNCSTQSQVPTLTETDVQGLIDKSLSSLLEGVLTNKPLDCLDEQTPVILVEPPIIPVADDNNPDVATSPSNADARTPVSASPAKAKRSYKKKA